MGALRASLTILWLSVACGDRPVELGELQRRLEGGTAAERSATLRELARRSKAEPEALDLLIAGLQRPRLRYESSMLLENIGVPAWFRMISTLSESAQVTPVLETLRLNERRTLNCLLALHRDDGERPAQRVVLNTLGLAGSDALVEAAARDGITPEIAWALRVLSDAQRNHLAQSLEPRDDVLARRVIRALPQDHEPEAAVTEAAVNLLRTPMHHRLASLSLATQGIEVTPRLVLESLVPASRPAVLTTLRLLGPAVRPRLEAVAQDQVPTLAAAARSLLEELDDLD